MFTIKWIDSNGNEALWLGSDVNFCPADMNTMNPGKAQVSFQLAPHTGNSSCTIDSGRVYVMNEQGKTVADYDLSDYSSRKTDHRKAA